MTKKVYITKTNCVTPLGFDVQSNVTAMLEDNSGIQYHENSELIEDSFYSAIIDDNNFWTPCLCYCWTIQGDNESIL